MPQGSVLGALLFINDIDDDIRGMILKFTDDIKVLGNVGIEEEI